MKPVRLPRLRCALLGLLPLWARDGGMRVVGSGGGAITLSGSGGVSASELSANAWKRVGGTVVTKKS